MVDGVLGSLDPGDLSNLTEVISKVPAKNKWDGRTKIKYELWHTKLVPAIHEALKQRVVYDKPSLASL